jgi:hypothetical protein
MTGARFRIFPADVPVGANNYSPLPHGFDSNLIEYKKGDYNK